MSLVDRDLQSRLAFSLFENRGVFALLLGSGLSTAAGIPTGWQITLDLIRRFAILQGEEEEQDWEKWHLQKVGKPADYSTLIGELGLSQTERRSILHSYIEPSPEDNDNSLREPTKAHLAIADLVRRGFIRLIVTTNFDRLLERALVSKGVEPTVVSSPDALAGAEPYTHSNCYVVKLHGDYKDSRIRNTEHELSGYPTEFNDLLDRIFDEHGLIVVGWSGEWDIALRAAFLRMQNRRYPTYWMARGDVGEGARNLIDHRRAELINIANADQAFAQLNEQVQALEIYQRQNPDNVELIVNQTKRYLAKPEFRIELNDLVTEQAERAVSKIGDAGFTTQDDFEKTGLQLRVSLFDSATEPLAKMFGAIGRWGSDSDEHLVFDALAFLDDKLIKPEGGTTGYLQIRNYPSVLVFSAYGVGLVRAARWQALHKFLTTTIVWDGAVPLRSVDHLFLWSWDGGQDDIWKELVGAKKAPLSAYLHGTLGSWGDCFLRPQGSFDETFERFEILASLAHLERENKNVVKQVTDESKHSTIRMPVGRASWSRRYQSDWFQDLKVEPTFTDLLSAGFAHGDAEFFELFCTNFRRISGHM